MRFIIFQNERIQRKEIVVITAHNYIRSFKLFIDMIFDMPPINQKRITRGLSSDRGIAYEEHIFSITFIAKIINGELIEGNAVTELKWVEINNIKYIILGFDHSKILFDYKTCQKNKGTYWYSKQVIWQTLNIVIK